MIDSRLFKIIVTILLTVFTALQPAMALPTDLDRLKLKLHFSGINIDASNVDDCLQKGNNLVRAGKDPELINEYCDDRYGLYAFCVPRKLSQDELSKVGLDFQLSADTFQLSESSMKLLRYVFVRNDTDIYLTDITIIATDSSTSHTRSGHFNLDHILPHTTSNTKLMTNQYQASINTQTGYNYGYYDKAEIISVMGCVP